MYSRKISNSLTHKDARDLTDAEHFSAKIRKKLNTTITVHPKLLKTYPTDVGKWVSKFLNKLRIWCVRRGFGYYALWVRENYQGDRHEHLHVLIHIPESQRPDLEVALRRWLPGDHEVVHLGRPTYRTYRHSRIGNKALTYVLKQMTPQAWFSLDKQVRREKRCTKTGLPVAPVLGKRCGVSRTLDKATRQAFWERRSTSPGQSSSSGSQENTFAS